MREPHEEAPSGAGAWGRGMASLSGAPGGREFVVSATDPDLGKG